MDTLQAVSAHHSQSAGPVHSPPKNDKESGGTVSVLASARALITAKLPEQNDQENKQQVSNAVKEISSFFQKVHSSLEFKLDDDSGKMIMQIMDTDTNKVIRQIPSEDVLRLAKRLDDLTGLLFKASA
jgi:flagellar protein FlaG